MCIQICMARVRRRRQGGAATAPQPLRASHCAAVVASRDSLNVAITGFMYLSALARVMPPSVPKFHEIVLKTR